MIDRRLIAAGAAALVVAAGLGFGAARMFDGGAEPSADARGDEHEEEGHAEEEGFVALSPSEAAQAGVTVTAVRRGGGADLVLPGRVGLAPNALAAIGAPVSGTVERVHVTAGSQVTSGAAIATVRSAEAASSRASADAAIAGARAAEAAAARDRRLLDAGVVARQEWEASQALAAKAQAESRAAQAQVRAMGGPGANGVTILRSPLGGVVTRVDVQVGGFLTQGALVAEVADQSRSEYVFDAPAAAAAIIRVGQQIRVQFPDGQESGASITAVAPGATGASSSTVRAKPAGPTPPTGSVVSARVLTREATGAIMAPSEAVQTLEGRAVVFVAEPKGFRARPVTPGQVAGGFTQIIRGLDGSERVAGKGAFLLKAELAKGDAEHGH